MTVDETLNQAFEALSGRLRAELQAAAREMTAALQEERARQSAAERATAPADEEDADRTLEGVRAIGGAGSLSEVLDTLASSAAREASRAAVLLVRDGRLRGWRFVGFPEEFQIPAAIDVALADSGPIADAVRSRAAIAGTAAPQFADLAEGSRCLAVPVIVGGQAVAVLYADEGGAGGGSASRTDNSELNTESSRLRVWPGRVEVLGQFAARCLEAITAFRAARLVPGRAAQAAPRGRDEHPDAVETGDADGAAQRYARLLVSEIKLYHEPDVMAGRRERDLAARLGPEIARARVLYEQRVPPQVGHRADYFQAELVRTLADGDAALLGVGVNGGMSTPGPDTGQW